MLAADSGDVRLISMVIALVKIFFFFFFIIIIAKL
jgi:hypothetical protein